jgi:branched-chain amino acid transport system permease protein
VVAPFAIPTFYVGEASFIFIMCIASLGLMTLTGFTGQVSLGQAAFLGIGAYTHAQLLTLGCRCPCRCWLRPARPGSRGWRSDCRRSGSRACTWRW